MPRNDENNLKQLLTFEKIQIRMRILILALLLLISLGIKAQDSPKNQIDLTTMVNTNNFIKLFDSKLNLSENQKKEFVKIHSKIQQMAISLLEDETIKTKEDYTKARQKIELEVNSEINKVLTAEQQKKYKLWQQTQQEAIKKK